LFVCEECERGRYYFTYRVRLTHTGDTSVDATLTRRKWVIVDAEGREDVVEGPGVIGQYPHVHPTCEPFEYESVCPLPTPTGSMGGRSEQDTPSIDVGQVKGKGKGGQLSHCCTVCVLCDVMCCCVCCVCSFFFRVTGSSEEFEVTVARFTFDTQRNNV
jgi:uncharacterized protein affecting Mg2+/Co2+ transport